MICRWTDKLPEDSRAAADEILLGARGVGLALADLAGLAGRCTSGPDGEGPDQDPGRDVAGPGGDAGHDDRRGRGAAR